MYKNQQLVEVCFSPRQFDLYKGQFDICVVIDVLRATSAICAGIENGVNSIIPVATIEEAPAAGSMGW